MHQYEESSVNADGITETNTKEYIEEFFVPCGPDPNSAAVLRAPLQIGDRWLTLRKRPISGGLANENILTITNLKNPSVFGTYEVDILTSKATAEDSTLEKVRESLVIAPPSITVNADTYSKASGGNSLIEIRFVAPLVLDKANRGVNNYYDTFTKIKLKFMQKTGADDSWDPKLGYNIPELSFLPCWATGDLKTYRGGLKCQLKFGNLVAPYTTADFATLTISNYKKMEVGGRFSVDLLANYPTVAANPPEILVEIIKIVANEEFTVSSTKVGLVTRDTAVGGALAGYTVTLSDKEVQKNCDLTIKFNTGTNYDQSNGASILVGLPDLWELSQNRYLPPSLFLDGTQIFSNKFYYDLFKREIFIATKDAFSSGAHTLLIKNIMGPVGATTTNNFVTTMIANKVRV